MPDGGSLGVNFEAAAPAAAQGAEPVSKTCRVGPRSREVPIQKTEPFKMFDNLYHVGPCYVAVYLLTTPAGHVLFDTTQEPFVDDTIANIQKVGVNLKDIKYIVLAHGHLDHVGGAKKFQDATGARRDGGRGRLEDDRSAAGQDRQSRSASRTTCRSATW